ncbi:hypothetical protein EDB19DRAFT_1907446 [Suillus lakei]|nr:hypothetical protein EDB19DRAFT_1907446 [Suillus lakei]
MVQGTRWSLERQPSIHTKYNFIHARDRLCRQSSCAYQREAQGPTDHPPPPDPLDIDEDSVETPDDFLINIPDPAIQGKGKGKALPLPNPITNKPTNLLNPDPNQTDTHNVPPIEPSALGHLGSHALANKDAMDDKPWEEFGLLQEEVLEQEDEYIIPQHHSAKCPYPSPSLPPTYAPDTTRFPSHGKFQTHADRTINHGSLHVPKPPSTITSSSASSSLHSHNTSSALSPSASLSACRPGVVHKPSQKSSLSKCVDAEIQDVHGQVQSLTDGMSYIYTAKAAASEYKITKVNANHHQCDIEFQHEQAEKDNEAAIIHQHTQEAKALNLQVLEVQAKVQAEKKTTLQLEIKLLKLRGGAHAASG